MNEEMLKRISFLAVSIILSIGLVAAFSLFTFDWFVSHDSADDRYIACRKALTSPEGLAETRGITNNNRRSRSGVSPHYQMNQFMYALSRFSGYIVSAGLGTCAFF
jgi:hypothetical protein